LAAERLGERKEKNIDGVKKNKMGENREEGNGFRC
jgi:hypothetical protein